MKSLQKLIYFFSSKYYNNLKFSNRMLHTTRIFFERTTKTSNSLQALGNVYRSSKWSDLHVYNIKESSLVQFKNMFFLLCFFIVCFFLSIRFNIGWTSLFIFNLTELIFYLKDLVFSWLLFLFYSVSLLVMKIMFFFTKYFQYDLLFLKDQSLKVSNSKKNIFKNTRKSFNFNVNTPGVFNSHTLLSSLYLQKLVKYLHLTNINDTQINLHMNTQNINLLSLYSIFKDNNMFVNYYLFFTSKNNFNLNDLPNLSSNFTNKDKLYYECVNNSNLFNTHFFKLNSNHLKSLSFLHQNEFKKVIKQNLNLGKENRWLMKNSLLSYDIINKTLSTTHVKKLYGNPQLNANSTNLNLWVSTKLSSNSAFTKNNSFINNKNFSLVTNNLNSSNLLNLNNLEESFFWLLKRFKFTQTTNTYYQFEQQYLSKNITSSTVSNPTFNNQLNLLQTVSLVNTSNFDNYTLHFSYKDQSNLNINYTDNTKLDLSYETNLNNFDLNFSKYFFNNINLQKNSILIYSNLDN